MKKTTASQSGRLGLTRRNTIADVPRKRSIPLPDSPAAKRKAASLLSPDSPAVAKNRTKDTRRKNSSSKSPNSQSVNSAPKRKLGNLAISPTSDFVVAASERKSSYSRPTKRRKPEVVGNDGTPAKIVKSDEAEKANPNPSAGKKDGSPLSSKGLPVLFWFGRTQISSGLI